MDASTSAIFPFSTGNSVSRLIWICSIQWGCSLFSFLTGILPLLGKLLPKNQMLKLCWNLVPRLIRICRIQWCCSFFSVLYRKHSFWTNLVQKIKIVSLSWNLLPKLIQICRIHWWCWYFLFYMGNTLFRQIWFKKSNLSV